VGGECPPRPARRGARRSWSGRRGQPRVPGRGPAPLQAPYQASAPPEAAWSTCRIASSSGSALLWLSAVLHQVQRKVSGEKLLRESIVKTVGEDGGVPACGPSGQRASRDFPGPAPATISCAGPPADGCRGLAGACRSPSPWPPIAFTAAINWSGLNAAWRGMGCPRESWHRGFPVITRNLPARSGAAATISQTKSDSPLHPYPHVDDDRWYVCRSSARASADGGDIIDAVARQP